MFSLFTRLPPELRMKIWRNAVPGGHIIEPYISPHLIDNMSVPFGGQFPQTVDTKRRVLRQAPALLAACRESRSACKKSGSFEFGILDNTHQGCWINYDTDWVFSFTNTMDHLRHVMNLRRVRQLMFPNSLFQTEERCLQVLHSIRLWAPRCQVVAICYCKEADQYGIPLLGISTARFDLLHGNDFVSQYSLTENGFSNELVKWADFRRSVVEIWNDYGTLNSGTKLLPLLIGANAALK